MSWPIDSVVGLVKRLLHDQDRRADTTRKPCSWRTLLRPPGRFCFSITVTSKPMWRSRSVAASPPNPAPMMMTDFTLNLSPATPKT